MNIELNNIIEKFAHEIEYRQHVDLSILCALDNAHFIMNNDFSTLSFTYSEVYPEELYVEIGDLLTDTITPKKRNLSFKIGITYEFPYFEQTHPAKLVATEETLFKVLEYTYKEKYISKKPNYKEIKNLICSAIEKLNVKTK